MEKNDIALKLSAIEGVEEVFDIDEVMEKTDFVILRKKVEFTQLVKSEKCLPIAGIYKDIFLLYGMNTDK